MHLHVDGPKLVGRVYSMQGNLIHSLMNRAVDLSPS